MWTPILDNRSRPKYRAIAETLASDIDAGILKPGDKLPPQRDLAWHLDVTVGTISRAYGEAERLGLVTGEVGRGTYVLRPGIRDGFPTTSPDEPEIVDLSLSFPAPGIEAACFEPTLGEIMTDPKSADLLNYRSSGNSERHRRAGATWLAESGLHVPFERIIVTIGAQNGILVALSAHTQVGDRVLTEALTFPGIKPVASMLGLTLEGVAMDEEGVIPDALEAACRTHRPRLLYMVPTIQNPTTAVMSPRRREEIAEVALRNNLMVVEDDICSRCLEDPPVPIAALLPENCIHLTSLSKTVAPGLRVGYLVPPEKHVESHESVLRATTWSAPGLMAEIATRWIEDGSAERILRSRRRESSTRFGLTRKILGGSDLRAVEGGHHIWLHLPEPWRADEFTAEARRRNIVVSPGEIFSVGRAPAPHAVRLCIGMPSRRSDLEGALKELATILRERSIRGHAVV